MPSSDTSNRHIPIHDLQLKGLEAFDYRLYHLKGSYSQQLSLPSMPGNIEVPHRHKYHEICFFSSGQGVHEIDFKKISIQPFSIHFVGAGQVHLLSSSHDVTGRVLAFSPGTLLNDSEDNENILERYPFINPINNITNLHLAENEFESIIRSVENLARDGDDWKSRSRFIIQNHIRIILEKCNYYISRDYQETHKVKPLESNFVSRYKNLVETHFREIHQVQDYGRMLNITPGHLNRYCKELYGTTASEIILERLILEAKRLLLFTEKSSKQIAYHLHFEDPSYFSRFFKGKTGYSPLKFRQYVREKYHQ